MQTEDDGYLLWILWIFILAGDVLYFLFTTVYLAYILKRSWRNGYCSGHFVAASLICYAIFGIMILMDVSLGYPRLQNLVDRYFFPYFWYFVGVLSTASIICILTTMAETAEATEAITTEAEDQTID